MFYDESRDGRLDDYRLADTASEFGVADTPGEAPMVQYHEFLLQKQALVNTIDA